MRRGLVLLALLATAAMAVAVYLLWPAPAGEGLAALRALPISTYVPAGATVVRDDQTEDRPARLLDPMPTSASIVRVIRPAAGQSGRGVALAFVRAAEDAGWVRDETFEDAWTFAPLPWRGFLVTLRITSGADADGEKVTISMDAPVSSPP